MQPIESHRQLDEPLHSSVRRDHGVGIARPGATTHFPPPPMAAQSDDIFALLDAEESQQPAPAPNAYASASASSSQAPLNDIDNALSDEVFSKFDPSYRPPSPSNTGFSREQAAMHMRLALTQSSDQSQQELTIPRPDNPALQEGVYAPTTEAALASIFDPSGRIESNTEEEEAQERGVAVVKKITRWFGASNYMNDVYGEGSLLRETIEEVLKPQEKGPGEEEKRERAIRRLESLWNHLSNTPPEKVVPQGAGGQGADWVNAWLKG